MPPKDKDTSAANGVDTSGESDRKRLVDHVEVVCEAILGSGSITIGRLGKLVPGETLILDSSPADPAEIRVNGKVIARGEVVTVDDRFAIRLTEIG